MKADSLGSGLLLLDLTILTTNTPGELWSAVGAAVHQKLERMKQAKMQWHLKCHGYNE